MKATLVWTVLVVTALFSVTADAYRIACNPGGTACNVYCNNGQLAGVMYWNGSQWSDGIRSSPDRNVVARQIVAAQGTACQ